MSSSYRHTIRQEYRTVCNIQASLAVADAMLAVVNPDEIVCGKPARILTAVLERNLLPAPTDDTQEQYQLAVIRFQRWLTDIYDHDTHPEWFRPDVGDSQAPPVSSPSSPS